MAGLHLILGGARSGKSRYAEQLAAQAGGDVWYIATAEVSDPEMAARIAQHRNDRPGHWRVQEVPLDLSAAIAVIPAGQVVLVDCLTLWLNNLLYHGHAVAPACDALLQSLQASPAQIFLVSNEISLGVVPLGETSRRYVDELGRLHQRIAQLAGKVTLMVAGIPLTVKETP